MSVTEKETPYVLRQCGWSLCRCQQTREEVPEVVIPCCNMYPVAAVPKTPAKTPAVFESPSNTPCKEYEGNFNASLKVVIIDIDLTALTIHAYTTPDQTESAFVST